MEPKEQEKNHKKISKSKYELTLSEFPLFLLSKKGSEGVKSIEYEDSIAGKDGERVKRVWKVFPHGELGFGSPSTFETLYDLFQIWKETDFKGQYIHFGSIYNLVKRRGATPGKQLYEAIRRDLECLIGVTIKAKNAFWDNELRAYVDKTFHLFDEMDLYKEKPEGQAVLPFAKMKASDVLYGSVQKNSLLTTGFDSAFFHKLTPVEQRLALYLSKIFRSQAVHKREVLEFAQQVPIYAKQTKHIKQQIKRACSGLIEKGFKPFQSFEFEKESKNSKEYIVFKRGGVLLPATNHGERKVNDKRPGPQKEACEIDVLVEDILAVCKDEKSRNFYKKVARLIPRETIYRALAEVRETRDCVGLKRNEGSLFTSLIKKYGREQGIEL